jgi:dihydrodipicolinate synthase/N-acetylneuraminate lyase
MVRIQGTCVALQTPFKENGDIDYDLFDFMIEVKMDNLSVQCL